MNFSNGDILKVCVSDVKRLNDLNLILWLREQTHVYFMVIKSSKAMTFTLRVEQECL